MLSRYQRVLDLSTFDENKLDILRRTKVIVIGAGGVGQHVLTYLVTNGIEQLTLVDFDKVEISNLNRQILLKESDIGLPKSEAVKLALLARNVDAKITSVNLKVTKDNINSLIDGYDVVVDAVDNWETKLIIAEATSLYPHQLHLHIGVDGEAGQYALFKNKSLLDIVDSSVKKEPKDGVLGPMVGTLASLGTLLLINYLVKNNEDADTLFSFDAKNNKIVKVKL